MLQCVNSQQYKDVALQKFAHFCKNANFAILLAQDGASSSACGMKAAPKEKSSGGRDAERSAGRIVSPRFGLEGPSRRRPEAELDLTPS